MKKYVGGELVSSFILRLEILHAVPVSPSITSFAGPARQTVGTSSTYTVTIGAGDLWTNLRVQIFYRTTLFGNWIELDDDTYTPVGSDPDQDSPLPSNRQHTFRWGGLDGAGTAYLQARVTASKGVAPNTLTATTTTAQTSTIFSAPVVVLPLPILPTISLYTSQGYQDGETVPSGTRVVFLLEISGGTYDGDPEVSWTVNAISVLGTTSNTRTISTAPVDGTYTIEVNVTVYGRGINARDGFSITGEKTLSLTWATQLPVAETPNIVFSVGATYSLVLGAYTGHVGDTVQITPTLTGGAYDTIEHRWVDSELTDNPWADGAPSTYNSALQSAGEKQVTLYVRVRGTGTNARTGTVDTGSEVVDIFVSRPLPGATAPTSCLFATDPVDPRAPLVGDGNWGSLTSPIEITARPSGGTHDRLTYAWSWRNHENIFTRTGTGNPLDFVPEFPGGMVHRKYAITLVITAHGDGTRARSGSTATATFRYNLNIELPLALAPNIRSLTAARTVINVGETVQITASIDYTVGVYDTIEHRWLDPVEGDNFWGSGRPSSVYDFSSSRAGNFTIQLEIRVRGNGTNAVNYATNPTEGQDTVVEFINIQVVSR